VVTRVLLIRHAAVDTRGRLCGSWNVPLSSVGRQQLAALLARPPISPPPDALLTSTLSRAAEVADALGRAWRRTPDPAPWAREIDCGDVEGMSLEQLKRERPDVWARNDTQADETFAWPGGETYARFRARILDGLIATAQAHAGRRIAVVTHAGVIAQVLGVFRGRPAYIWKPDRPDPLTGTEVTWENGAPAALVKFNDPDWY